MAFGSIIKTGRSMATSRRQNKAERVVWREARSAYKYMRDTDRHETRWNIGKSPDGMEDEEYMHRVGAATVQLCQIHSPGNDIYIYDHEASIEATEDIRALPEETIRHYHLRGLRAVIRKIMDPTPHLSLEELSDSIYPGVLG